ncbi:hypothetical protein Lal_00026379 [Lupinus albus]|nr:hypothetical protein Lal_00026379 [Lupinus albus]
MAPSYCVKESKQCVIWVEKYFKDCLCNLKDEISFGLGFFSLMCWGAAEIPQIITNFQTKSSHGVSLTFILAWVAGDMFNLMGCLLEPATLYTVTTIILASQSLYYEYIYSWCKRRHNITNEEAQEDETKPLILKPGHESVIPIPNVRHKSTPRHEFHYISARSMAGSGTPHFCSYIRAAKSGPSAMPLNNDSSSDDDEAPTVPFIRPTTQPRSIPRSNARIYGTFLAASATLPMRGNALKEGYVLFHGRNLLQEHAMHSSLGQWLGWLMAAIYMGGRLPQIWLNGLNPLMFVFALIANSTYVGSILVRTTEWESIKANLPWLLDAVVCVALDLFIIMQYVYYRNFRRSASNDDYEDCNEASKADSS